MKSGPLFWSWFRAINFKNKPISDRISEYCLQLVSKEAPNYIVWIPLKKSIWVFRFFTVRSLTFLTANVNDIFSVYSYSPPLRTTDFVPCKGGKENDATRSATYVEGLDNTRGLRMAAFSTSTSVDVTQETGVAPRLTYFFPPF